MRPTLIAFNSVYIYDTGVAMVTAVAAFSRGLCLLLKVSMKQVLHERYFLRRNCMFNAFSFPVFVLNSFICVIYGRTGDTVMKTLHSRGARSKPVERYSSCPEEKTL